MSAHRPTTRLPGREPIAVNELQHLGESSHVRAPPCEACDLAHRIEGDYGDARFIEHAMFQLHHLHGSPVPAPDLRGQVLPENRHLCAIRRANMRRKVSLSTVFTAVRSKQEEV